MFPIPSQTKQNRIPSVPLMLMPVLPCPSLRGVLLPKRFQSLRMIHAWTININNNLQGCGTDYYRVRYFPLHRQLKLRACVCDVLCLFVVHAVPTSVGLFLLRPLALENACDRSPLPVCLPRAIR